ncbi:MAG: ArgE/DapE family deacylase [Deltaproteobacteria bacterium]|nr:ArgE/DapE family deacylase [Deltaproteobacteria bacterium]
MTKKEVLAELGRRRKELASLCSKLIRIPSENPPGDTTKLAAFVRGYLRAKGFTTKTYEPKKGRPNVVASTGEGRPNLVLSGHMDEFPAGEGWTFPPFSGAVRNGRILGRGAGDMKAGLAVSLMAAALIKEMGIKLRGSLTLALVSDEETGGVWGTQWLLKNVRAVRGDACLIGESSGTWAVGVGEKGVLWLRIRASGVSGHAAYGQGESAIVKVLKVLEAISKLHGKRTRPRREIETLIRRQRPAVEKYWGPGTGTMADKITVNVGTLRGGGQVNLIPRSCEAEVDIRVPPGMTTSTVEREVRQRVKRLRLNGVQVETLNRCDSYVTPAKEKLITILRANSLRVCGSEALMVLRLGYTDGRFFRRAGIPTAIYGPTVHNMGGPDEWVEEEELLRVARVHLGIIVDYLGGRTT